MTTCNTCNTCRHWGSGPNDVGHRLKECDCPKFVKTYDRDEYAAIPEDGVAVERDEGWGFETGPKFGCIHHAEGAKSSPRIPPDPSPSAG